MKRILLKNSVDDTLSNTAGVSLFIQLDELIDSTDKIILDLKGTDAISSSFFNSSFGALIEKFGYQKIKSSLKFINATKTQVNTLSYLFNSCKKFSY